jgi:selenocysteine-specific elongation factor
MRDGGSPSAPAGADPPLHVVATAGHVDHGKSSLIIRLTGIDPDRLAEEQRRGLTIDLGFAWGTLPSGVEIGFVDVPGHERFVRNMLAGVGPVRLVLFVVAADEGWKPQSEEHLDIVDVLGVDGAVVALTKRDLVDDARLAEALADVRAHLRGTALEGGPIVGCSTRTGEGLDELSGALDAMIAAAPAPEQDGRPRQFVDRIFTIRGAGTVVTGTLTGGRIAVGDEVEIYPNGVRARVRGLQTHKRAIEVARPVSRVATNLTGIERNELERGDVLGRPGDWRPTRTFEGRLRPVRGLERPLTARGAFKLYAGSAERDVRINLYGRTQLEPGEGTYVRIRLSAPLVLDVGDRFVIREAGRRATVAGGVVLDPNPPARPGPDAGARLAARELASRQELPALLVAERGAVRAPRVTLLTGMTPSQVAGAERIGAWWVSEELRSAADAVLLDALARFHEEHPLAAGEDVTAVREVLGAHLSRAGTTSDPSLVDALLSDLEQRGTIAREGKALRLSTHLVAAEQSDDIHGLVETVAAGEPTPPTVAELLAAGIDRETIEAAVRAELLVRVSKDLVMTPGFVQQGREAVLAAGAEGITVSAFREALGTSRKYALPLLEHFDARGISRREGDVRVARKLDAADPPA